MSSGEHIDYADPSMRPPTVDELALQLRSDKTGEGRLIRTHEIDVLKNEFLDKIRYLGITGRGINLITDALNLGLKIHEGETRRDTNYPYYIHPLRIANRLADQGYDSPVAYAIVLLHDVQENQLITPQEIIDHFTPEWGEDIAMQIALGVDTLSNERVRIDASGNRIKEDVDLEDYYENIALQDSEYSDLYLPEIKTEDRFDNLMDYITFFLDDPTDETRRGNLERSLDSEKTTLLEEMLANIPDLLTRLQLAINLGRKVLADHPTNK